MFPILAHKDVFVSLIKLYISGGNIIFFCYEQVQKVLFSVTSFVSVQSRLSVLKVAEKNEKTISTFLCFTEKKCLQTQKLRNPFYRVLKNK